MLKVLKKVYNLNAVYGDNTELSNYFLNMFKNTSILTGKDIFGSVAGVSLPSERFKHLNTSILFTSNLDVKSNDLNIKLRKINSCNNTYKSCDISSKLSMMVFTDVLLYADTLIDKTMRVHTCLLNSSIGSHHTYVSAVEKIKPSLIIDVSFMESEEEYIQLSTTTDNHYIFRVVVENILMEKVNYLYTSKQSEYIKFISGLNGGIPSIFILAPIKKVDNKTFTFNTNTVNDVVSASKMILDNYSNIINTVYYGGKNGM